MKSLAIASLNGPVMACVMSHVPMPAKNHDRPSHARTTLVLTTAATIINRLQEEHRSRTTAYGFKHMMSQVSSSSPAISTQGASFVTASVNHPRFLRTDSESVRVFLRLYDQYSNEVTPRAEQLTVQGATSSESIRPVNLKFCVDP